MRPISARVLLGAVTVALLVLVVALIIHSQSAPPTSLGPRDVVSGSVAEGRRVTVVGKTATDGSSVLVLVPVDSSAPSLRVTMSAKSRAHISRGVVIGVEGLVTASREITDARLVFPTGPSKYQSVNSAR